MHDRLITSNSVGKPVIAGTHVTVEEVLKELAVWGEVDRILTAHPELDRDAVQAALEFAAERMHGPARQATLDMAQVLGDFVPHTPLAKKLWERRKAIMKEALERGEPLLHGLNIAKLSRTAKGQPFAVKAYFRQSWGRHPSQACD